MKAKFNVTSHLEDLWRYARVLTRDDDDADDLVQESLARALELARTYDASRPLLPWLVRVVRNTYLSSVARANSERRRREAYAMLSDSLLLPSQEHSLELSDVRKALRSIPIEQAEVLHLVGVLGFTYSDSAEALGVPIGTVMSRLSRARAALRDIVDGSGDRAPPHLKIVGGRSGSR